MTFRVYAAENSQADVFLDYVKPLVHGMFDAQSFCVVTFGASATGKSHTMTGGVTGDSRGVAPRAIEEMIRGTASLLRS